MADVDASGAQCTTVLAQARSDGSTQCEHLREEHDHIDDEVGDHMGACLHDDCEGFAVDDDE